METIRINLNVLTPSQYSNFDFNSMADFNGRLIAAGDNGLFCFSCNADSDEVVDAYFDTGESDFGTSKKKGPRYIYAQLESDGDFAVTVTSDRTSVSSQYLFERSVETGAPHHRRAKLGMGLKFTYGQFRFSNVAGSDFSIDLAKLLYIVHGKALF